MYQYFTEKALRVIMLAQEESKRLDHNYVGSEMLFLGLLAEGTGLAAKILRELGISFLSAREGIDNIIGRGSSVNQIELPFTQEAKNVLLRSQAQMEVLSSGYIGTEHLLLGLVQETPANIEKILHAHTVDFKQVQDEVLRRLNEIKPAAGA